MTSPTTRFQFLFLLVLMLFVGGATTPSRPNVEEPSGVKAAQERYQQQVDELKKHRKRAFDFLNHRRKKLSRQLVKLRANQNRYGEKELKSRKITLRRKFLTLERRRKRLDQLFKDRRRVLQEEFERSGSSTSRKEGAESAT